ncbi:MAG: tol-pal system YbgF family protein [Saprospiraceae bacterium]
MLRITIYRVLIAFCAIALSHTTQAQDISHKQADDFADWLVADGQFSKAAGLYADAFKEKSRNVYAYKAAELYFAVKDYSKAAKFYEAVAKNSTEYPKAGLMYARSLKQMCNYDDALTQFNNFSNSYTAEDSAAVRATVKQDIAGTELAIEELTRVDPTVFVDRLGQSINGMKNEISPAIGADGAMTFVSDFDGTMRVYSSSKGRNGWSQMRPAKDFPVLEEGHIGGLTIASDDRIYVSICDQTQNMIQPAVNCQINVITRMGNAWGAPKPVKGNINVEGASSLQPFVFQADDKEVMIFASNRANGYGGMDLWRTERSIDSDISVFATPINLGTSVNGAGDEVTPFFNTETRVLSYSSNGGVTLGGYDVFHSTTKDDLKTWTTGINPGTPVNSTADDYHYMEVEGSSTAYLSSNRMEDMTTTHFVNDDVYQVTYDNPNVTIEFAVLDDKTGKPVSDPTINVQLNPDGRMLKPLTVRRSIDGYFSLTLPVDRDIVIDVTRPYFDESNTTLFIPLGETDGFEIKPFRLDRTRIGKDDILVVSRSEKIDNPTAIKREIMTASGEKEGN